MEKIKKVEFRIIAQYLPDGKGQVQIDAYQVHNIDAPFDFWMMACEYLLHKTAQKSKAGYEKAMELLVKGAMTYRDIK
jgi:hypothetical protein